ncbi:MAG: phosphotransferase family protein [Promethearchaeota archaeon]
MTFYEETRATDLTLSEVIDCLNIFFPDIEEKDISFFYHGTYNVFEVKNQFIFRIPDKAFRNQKGVELIQNEVKMLNHIQKYVSVSVPDPIYISIDPEYPVMGYEKIDGVPLSRKFNKISKSKRMEIAEEIGHFLTELHSKELYQNAILKQIVDVDYSCEKYKLEWKNYFKNVQKLLFPIMNSTQKNWIINLFDSFLNNDANFKFKQCIIHGDFDISNIVVDTETYKITAIVDFEESRVYDPAVDFIFYEGGNEFLRKTLTSYEGLIDPNFEERMKFLYGRSCLGYIEFGLKNNLADMIDVGFKLLETRMEKIQI